MHPIVIYELARTRMDLDREAGRHDPLPETGSARKGVPQGRHAHGLLLQGAQILDQLFPGLLPDLAAEGAPVLRHPREFRFFLGGHLLCQDGEPGEPAYAQSRPYLEHRVRALPNVTVRDQCDVAGLVTTPAHDRVHRQRGPGGRRGAQGVGRRLLGAHRRAGDGVCRRTGRAPQKVRLVEFVEEIPKTPSGKILRCVLIERGRARSKAP